MRRVHSVLLAAVIAVLCLPCAASASDAQIVVHTCKYPDGSTAPFYEAQLSDAASFGWGRRGATPTSNTACVSGGIMTVGNPGTDLNLNEWVFKVPAATSIRSFTVQRTLVSHSAAATSSQHFLIANDQVNSDAEVNNQTGVFTPSGQVFQACKTPGVLVSSYPDCGAASGTYSFAPINPAGSHYLHVVEFCDNAGGSCSASNTQITRAAVTVGDPNPPAGALVDPSSGAQDLKGSNLGIREFKVRATDPETGLLSAEIRLNGKTVVGPKAFDQAGVECADKYSGAGGEGYDYNVPQPCPTSGTVDLSFDTSSLPVGKHTVEVIITDAAGNQTVLGREITVPGDGTSNPERFIWEKVTQCSDGLDNDGDGKVDRDDPGCHTDGDPTNDKTYDASRDDESDTVKLCTTVTAKFQPGKFERAYTRVSKTGKTAITYKRKAKRRSGKSLPRVRVRGKLTGVKGCVAYFRIGKTQRQISKRDSNGAFTEFYFEGLRSGTMTFRAKKNSVKLHVKRRV
jgi:hypothetical protein